MNDTALLQLWEAALPLPSARRTQLLAQAGGAQGSPTLGMANRALLQLHERLCGTALPLHVACPRCAAELEFTLDAAALAATAPALPGAAEHAFTLGELQLRIRLPNAEDLLALEAAASAEAAAQALFERCVLRAEAGGRELPAAQLDTTVRAAVAAAIDDIEPLASLVFDLSCAECGHAFQAPLDLAAVTYAELCHRAEQVLADVAALAHAYGWREADVLALSPVRRAAYLQLCGAEAGG
jgi:hypothetical protein